MKELDTIPRNVEDIISTSKSELALLETSSEPGGSLLNFLSSLLSDQERDEHGQWS